MKITSIVGARPQFIKLAPLSMELRKYHQELIIHTGQHFDREMSESFFQDLGIPKPDYNLNVNKGLHGEQTGHMLIELEKVLVKEKPDLIIVFGDTNTTLAGALAGAKLHIPIVHVEAGLRSFNRSMPEEINRIVADQLSTYLFCPTETALKNLKNEGFPHILLKDNKQKITNTGDIMVDAHSSALDLSLRSSILEKLTLIQGEYYLLTLHRPYNVDDPDNMSSILAELGKLAKKVVFPVHPRTRQVMEQNQIPVPSNIQLIKPVGYLDFVRLQADSLKIITDSGGIQKEAYILKKPCVTLRSETEWVETVEAGWNLLLNPLTEHYYSERIASFVPPARYENIFGQSVAEKMVGGINGI